ncbi:hypothetical protein EV121DRAFT_286730 [Schizophyllum commune]
MPLRPVSRPGTPSSQPSTAALQPPSTHGTITPSPLSQSSSGSGGSTNGGGFRAHLNHLLPRHTQLHVNVQIHQLSSVPLVSGEFACRWKLKGVQSNPAGKGLLKKPHGHHHGHRSRSKSRPPQDRGGDHELAPSADNASISGRSSSSLRSPGIPSVVVHSDERPSTSSSPLASPTPSAPLSPPASPESAPSLSVSDASTAEERDRDGEYITGTRGQTPFKSLRDDHSVRWEQSINAVVKIPITRPPHGSHDADNFAPYDAAPAGGSSEEPGILEPCPLKLVVIQDPKNGPTNPRLGAVYLDLSEYASLTRDEKGGHKLTRRYLLSESKVNATLQLTITMTYFGGSRAFLCPPLPKGEILSGISSFGLGELGGDDVFRTRPDTSSLFGWGHERDGMPPSSSPTSSIYSLYNPSRSRTHLNATPSALSSNTGEDSGSADGSSDAGSNVAGSSAVPPDAAKPVSEAKEALLRPFTSPKATEVLIDALFNPMPMATPLPEDPTLRPFLVYQPAPPEGEKSTAEEIPDAAAETASMRSSDGGTMASGSNSTHSTGRERWWKRRLGHSTAALEVR